jgi:hypothetical protein
LPLFLDFFLLALFFLSFLADFFLSVFFTLFFLPSFLAFFALAGFFSEAADFCFLAAAAWAAGLAATASDPSAAPPCFAAAVFSAVPPAAQRETLTCQIVSEETQLIFVCDCES